MGRGAAGMIATEKLQLGNTRRHFLNATRRRRELRAASTDTSQYGHLESRGVSWNDDEDSVLSSRARVVDVTPEIAPSHDATRDGIRATPTPGLAVPSLESLLSNAQARRVSVEASD